MLKSIIKQDWRLLKTSRLTFIVFVLLFAFMLLAAWNGASIYKKRIATQNEISAYENKNFTTVVEKIKAIEAADGVYEGSPFQDPRSAYTLSSKYGARYILYPFQPVSSWVVGQSDLYPPYYRITGTKKAGLILNDEIENPQILFTGSFDLAFVLIYLLPLLIIVFTYNIVGSERELGTLRLLLSNPVSLRRIVASKFLFRTLLFMLVFLASLLICSLLTQVPLNNRFLTFVLMGLAWIIFWFALCFCANGLLNKSAGSTAGALVTVWLLFVLLLPGIFSYLVNSNYPVPSRIALITKTRDAAEEVKKRSSKVLSKYLEDHPEMAKDTAGINPNDFATKFFTSQIDLEQTIEPIENEFSVQLQKQNEWVSRFIYFSPALVIQENLFRIANTDQASYKEFETQVKKFYKNYQSFFTERVIGNKTFTSADIAGVPTPGVPTLEQKKSNGLAYLLLLSLVFGLLGWVGLRKVVI